MPGNSCANFVQTRAGPVLMNGMVGPDLDVEVRENIAFVDRYDGFVMQGSGPSDNEYLESYKLSETKMRDFQKTLTRFTEILQKRKVFNRLGVHSRDPRDFDLDYVLSIASRISEWRETDEETRICKRFIRKICQKATKHKNVLSGLISLAPSDAYGSVISGGFTLILAAIEGHEKLRLEMQGAIADIPRNLSRISKLTNVQIKRDELHQRADEVLVAIFHVLERIIERLSRTWQDKSEKRHTIHEQDNLRLRFCAESITSKFKDDGGHVKMALQSLENSIIEFNDEAVFCSQLRLGRIEENGLAVKLDTKNIKAVVDNNSHRLVGIESRLNEMAFILNKTYSFTASGSAFNAVDGTLRPDVPRVTEKQFEKSTVNESLQLAQNWLQTLHGFDPSPEEHIKRCISHMGSLDIEQQDKILYTLESKSFQSWLQEPDSPIFHVRAETVPTDIINFMSVFTASLVSTIHSCTDFVVFSVFCGIRKSISLSEGDSGVLGILRSLNGQMLNRILEKHIGTKVSFEENEKVWSKSHTSTKYAWTLFKSLISLLPHNTVVFILLDSVSRISGDKAEVDDLVQSILKIATRHAKEIGIVIKILITDIFPTSRIRTMAKEGHSLYVPDDVEGWSCGINHRAAQEKNVVILRNLQTREDSSSSSDDIWDLSSEDGSW